MFVQVGKQNTDTHIRPVLKEQWLVLFAVFLASDWSLVDEINYMINFVC